MKPDIPDIFLCASPANNYDLIHCKAHIELTRKELGHVNVEKIKCQDPWEPKRYRGQSAI